MKPIQLIAKPLKYILPNLYHQVRERVWSASKYQLISPNNVPLINLQNAWKDANIPIKQREIVNYELEQMYKGQVAPIFHILATAIQATKMAQGEIVEVGCGSGHYFEVLCHLLGHPIQYVGLDYSEALILQARHYYASTAFTLGDATALPMDNQSCDILISGCVLLHVPDYQQVIKESARISRQWVIFHRTPIVIGPTLHYTKFAYGVKCVEIAFGEAELYALFHQNGLKVVQQYEIGQNALPHTTYQGYGKTYLCQKLS